MEVVKLNLKNSKPCSRKGTSSPFSYNGRKLLWYEVWLKFIFAAHGNRLHYCIFK